MLPFRWNFVGFFISEDHRGFQILSDLREEMNKHRICEAFVEMIPVTIVSFFPKCFVKTLPDLIIISKCDHHLWLQ
jgi:vomeronasal 2 receptor